MPEKVDGIATPPIAGLHYRHGAVEMPEKVDGIATQFVMTLTAVDASEC